MLKVLILSLAVIYTWHKPFVIGSSGLKSDRRYSEDRDKSSGNDSPVPVRYDGAQLWKLRTRHQVEIEAVAELETKYDAKVWKTVGDYIDLMIEKPMIENALSYLRNSSVLHLVLNDDLQKAIEDENPSKEEIEFLQNRKGHRLTWQAYHILSDITGYLDYLAKTYPELCSVKTIGSSNEGRPLKVLKISNGQTNTGVWIDGGIHAREWISPASVTYIINYLIENWEELPSYLKNIDWHILPVHNPDGYEYTHKYDRLWRKNRRKNGSNQCQGVDLNRNYGYRFGGQGTSLNPCSEIYRGAKGFSEPETAAVQNYITQNGKGKYFKAFLTFHSYGQFILYPWGYNRSVPPDHEELNLVGKQAAASMKKAAGAIYKVGSSGILLYPAAGGSDDWAKGSMAIKYSYTVELRDEGRYGFLLPASFIEKSGEDAVSFIDAIARSVALL